MAVIDSIVAEAEAQRTLLLQLQAFPYPNPLLPTSVKPWCEHAHGNVDACCPQLQRRFQEQDLAPSAGMPHPIGQDITSSLQSSHQSAWHFTPVSQLAPSVLNGKR
jgi:hypothetical protein